MKKLICVILLFCLSGSAEQQVVNKMDAEAGEKAAMSVLKGLRKKLTEEMAKNLLTSVEYCHENAIPLTENFFKEHERVTEVKRTSLKIRNPKNAPDEREKAMLVRWDGLAKKKALPPFEMETVSGGEVRYYKPLRVEGMCLTCHGNPSKEIVDVLKKKYPGDQATGYQDGELRGLIRISLKPQTLSK